MRSIRLQVLCIAVTAACLQGCGPVAGGDLLEVPSAPGSRSPHLAAGSDGTLVLSWVEPDGDGHRLSYSSLGPDGWNAPRSAARGRGWFVNWADVPSVVPVSGPLWAAHWLEQQPAGGYAYDVAFSVSTDGGNTWSEGVVPHDDGTPTEHGFVTLFPQDDGVGLMWLDGRNMAQQHSSGDAMHGMTLRSATYSGELDARNEQVADELVCDCCPTDVAVTSQGPVAVYRNRNRNEMRDVYASRFANGAWQPGRPVAEDGWNLTGCPVNGPVIAADGDRVAVAWFTAANGAPRIRMARSADAGASFSDPVDVSDDDNFGRTGVAMLRDGAVAVSWLCRESDDSATLCLRAIDGDDRPGPVQVLSGPGGVPPLSVPQLARAGDVVVAAWTVTDDGVTQVRSRRIPVEALMQTL